MVFVLKPWTMERHHLLKPFLVWKYSDDVHGFSASTALFGFHIGWVGSWSTLDTHGCHILRTVWFEAFWGPLQHPQVLLSLFQRPSCVLEDAMTLWSFGSLSSYMDAILFHLVLIWVYVCSISATVGSYLLSVKLAGYIYDRQVATVQAAALATGKILTGPHKCIGPQCFRSADLCLAWVFREYHCNHQKCWVDKVRWTKRGCTISFKDMESSSKLSCNELKQNKTI
jgi:hypothetical protein